MSLKPLIFISCGQFSPDETALGKLVESLIRDETPYDAYFAEQQNTLEDLSSNVLAALGRAAAFVGIMHHRGSITTPAGTTITRGSVWIEQEVAIAAFIQNALARRMDVALYLQRGLSREGIRSQLRLAPVEFDTPAEVMEDLRARLAGWNLVSVHPPGLIAEIDYKLQRPYSGERHPYVLQVDLFNNGPAVIDQWRAEIWFPSIYIEGADQSQPFVYTVTNDTHYSADAKRLFPGDRLTIFNINYVITHANWPEALGWPGRPYVPPKMRVRVASANAPPWELEVSAKDIQKF